MLRPQATEKSSGLLYTFDDTKRVHWTASSTKLVASNKDTQKKKTNSSAELHYFTLLKYIKITLSVCVIVAATVC